MWKCFVDVVHPIAAGHCRSPSATLPQKSFTVGLIGTETNCAIDHNGDKKNFFPVKIASHASVTAIFRITENFGNKKKKRETEHVFVKGYRWYVLFYYVRTIISD